MEEQKNFNTNAMKNEGKFNRAAIAILFEIDDVNPTPSFEHFFSAMQLDQKQPWVE